MQPPQRESGSGNGTEWLSVLIAAQPSLIAGMTLDAMAAMLDEAQILHLRRPRQVLRQGETARKGYLILRGRIEVSFIDTDGNRVLAHLAGPGEALGEVEQFSGRTCAASCTTLPETTVMVFDANLILRHLPAPLLLRNLAGIFHDRLVRDTRQRSVALFYAAEDRVRIHLLSLTSVAAPEVRLSQTELAGFAGCSRQTVNKTLSALRAEGIVQMGRGAIRVLDRARLEGTRPQTVKGLPDEDLRSVPPGSGRPSAPGPVPSDPVMADPGRPHGAGPGMPKA
ncbi:Crp/Fnr family transcriptional regulator [Paracoccus gahaiensis]|nr:Crp/Fnr family transcriptional regulator [Paracoccus gahaiensis]